MEGIIGVIIGSVIGATITLITFYFNRKDKLHLAELERKDKFKMVAIEQRLAAHQLALDHWQKMLNIIHSKDDNKKIKVLNSAKDFWFKNSLYLEKETRKRFSEVIHLVSFYGDKLEMWRSAEKGLEKKNANDELMSDWNKIMELPNFIQNEVELESINPEINLDALNSKQGFNQ